MWMEEMLEGLLGAHQSLEMGSVNHTTVNLELSKSIIDLEKTLLYTSFYLKTQNYYTHIIMVVNKLLQENMK